MNIYRKAVIFITFLVLSLSSQAGLVLENEKALGVDKGLIDAALVGQDLLLHRRYDAAIDWFEAVSEKYPESPTGAFGRLAAWQLRMFENEDFRFMGQYRLAERAYEKISQRELRRGNVPPWDIFICSAADGMRSFFKAREGKWLPALTNALHAVRLIKQLKWRRPDFVDNYLGLGMYKYWRSVMTNRIKVLPIFGDHRAEGIRMVERVNREGEYAKDLAAANLVFIYWNEKRYKEAAKIADELLARFPENLIFQFVRGKIAYEQKRYAEALTYFERVYASDPAIGKALYYKGRVLQGQKKPAEAKGVFELYLKKERAKDWRAWGYYRLGTIEEGVGDFEAAKRNYKRALELDRKVKPAQKRLEGLSSH